MSQVTVTDLSMRRRADVASYRDLLSVFAKFGFHSMTHAQWFATRDAGRVLLLRHDVDHDLELGLEVARVEHAMGLVSTFFLLPPGDYGKTENYYGNLVDGRVVRNARMLELAAEIQGLGHEIGIHNDFVQLGSVLGRDPAELLAEEIAALRAAGLDVRGSASHGSRFARANAYVNYELFSERGSKAGSEPRIVSGPNGWSFPLGSVSYRQLGLDYEAYEVPFAARISDVGGRFDFFVRNGGAGGADLKATIEGPVDLDWIELNLEEPKLVVMLVHPDWWTPFERQVEDSEPSHELPADFALTRADGKPFRIALRGDCCSRRAVQMNRDLFPGGVSLLSNAKAPNVCFLDAIEGKTATASDIEALCDVGAMSRSMAHYFREQIDRSALEAEDLDLLVMDTYSDMNFSLWQSRAHGWKVWVHPKFLKDREAFERDFVNVGQRTLGEAVADAVGCIEAIRRRNPGLPVLFLDQPIAYYDKLSGRAEFGELAARVARRLPDVFLGGNLAKEDLEPDDMGSCGPGQTLHFKGATYRRMIAHAVHDGLLQSIARHQSTKAASLLRPEAAPAASPEAEAASTPPTPLAARPTAQVISLMGDCSRCSDIAGLIGRARTSFASYFLFPGLSVTPPKYHPVVIGMDEIAEYEPWEAMVKKKYDRIRYKKRAQAAGFYTKIFNWRMHIPDIYEINTSLDTRSGREMKSSYLQSIAELGGAPTRLLEPVPPDCPHHWVITFGVFRKEPGHMQGTVVVDERLVGYIMLRRTGEVALYSKILGHGDHLKTGVMLLLHHDVVRWASENAGGLTRDLKYLMYGAVENGGESLWQWKRCGGFHPVDIDAYVGPALAAEDVPLRRSA